MSQEPSDDAGKKQLVTQTMGGNAKGFLSAALSIQWEDKKILLKNVGRSSL